MARELWSLSGAYWVLPLSVEWYQGGEICGIRIGAGLRLLDVQRQTAIERLKEIGAIFRENRWILNRKTLEENCLQELADPESILEWHPPHRSKSRKFVKFRSRDEFFHEFVKGGWVKSAEAAEVLWLAFCKHCLWWLVNRQRPIDMGFAQLCPVPLRANWKALLLQTHREKRAVKYPQPPWMLMRMVADYVTEPTFNAFARKPRRLIWHLEVIPEAAWFRASAIYERERYPSYTKQNAKQRRYRYASYCRDAIKRSLPFLTRLYAAYLANIKRTGARFTAVILPSGAASKRVNDQRLALRRVPPADWVPDGDQLRDAPEVAVAGNGHPDEADPLLRSVSDLRQDAPDLRGSEC